MTSAKKVAEAWRHNQTAHENGWGNIAIPITPGKKSPVWGGWQNPALKYDPTEPGYAPEGFDLSGCGVGFRAGVDFGDGTCLLGLDIDVKDWTKVGRIMEVVRKFFGSVVTREGLPPKVLVPLRVFVSEATGWKPSPIQVGDGHKIEIIYRGKQFVWEGIHPDTGKAYTHSKDLLGRHPSEMTVVDMSTLISLWAELRRVFSVSPGPETGVSGENRGETTNLNEVAGNSSKGSYVNLDVERILAALRRGEDIHENMLRVVASLVNGGMDGGMVRDWIRDRKVLETLPRETERLGALDDEQGELGRIIEGAVSKYGKGSKWGFLNEGLRGGVASAAREFGPLEGSGGAVGAIDENDPFAPVSETQKLLERMVADVWAKYGARGGVRKLRLKDQIVRTGWNVDPATLPLTPFLDEGQTFLKGALMAVQGKPAVNKSTFIVGYILHLMTGIGGSPLGAVMRMGPDGKVCLTDADREAAGKALKALYISADDPDDVVQKRVTGWCKHWKVPQVVRDTLEDRFHAITVRQGVAGWSLDTPQGREELRELLREEKYDIVVGDPAANLIPQSDAGNDEALAVLKEVISEFAGAGVAAVFVWHTRKGANAEGAESALEDIRGAGAIGGAIRGAKDLRGLSDKECEKYGLDPRATGDRGGWSYRKLSHTKNSYGERQGDLWLRLVKVQLGNIGVGLKGDTAAVLEVVDLDSAAGKSLAADAQILLDVLIPGTTDGAPWSDDNRATDRSIHREMEGRLGWERARTTRVLNALKRGGYVTTGEVKVAYGNKKKVAKGLIVADSKHEWVEESADCDPFAAL